METIRLISLGDFCHVEFVGPRRLYKVGLADDTAPGERVVAELSLCSELVGEAMDVLMDLVKTLRSQAVTHGVFLMDMRDEDKVKARMSDMAASPPSPPSPPSAPRTTSPPSAPRTTNTQSRDDESDYTDTILSELEALRAESRLKEYELHLKTYEIHLKNAELRLKDDQMRFNEMDTMHGAPCTRNEHVERDW
jgi:hypothetical protein